MSNLAVVYFPEPESDGRNNRGGRVLLCNPGRPLQAPPGPSGPRIPKESPKSLPGPSGPRVQKVSETVSKESPESQINNSLMGSFGKGSLQKVFRRFPRNFRRISAPYPGAIKHSFRELSAEFPQTFRKLSAKTPSLTTP